MSKDADSNLEAELGLEEIPATHADSVRKLADAMQRNVLIFATGTVLLGVILSGLLAGWKGIVGALIGGGIALASSLGTLWLMRISAPHGPHAGMAAAMGGFVGKLVVIFVALTLLRGVSWLHPKALAFTMVAVVLVAAAADMRAFAKTKIPTIIPTSENS